MKRILIALLLTICCINSHAQYFEKRTCTETLKEQTMMFKYEHSDEQYAALALWGKNTGLGADLTMVDLTESPKPNEFNCEYEIIDNFSLYLTINGQRFMLVVFHKDYAYLYFADEDSLLLKLPRTI